MLKEEISWPWKLSDKVLKKQIEGYDTLKIYQTYRGMTVIFFAIVLAVSLALAYAGIVSFQDFLIGLVLYMPLLFFIYFGHKWALIVLFILWTVTKIITLIIVISEGSSLISPIIWFLIGASIIFRAYIVEKERTHNK